MGAPLSKTRSVLDIRTSPVMQVAGAVTFVGNVGDDGDSMDRVVIIDTETWADLGSPNQITVAIEPGDTLND